MKDKNNREKTKNNFLYPSQSYHGKFNPNKLVFNANLQEFARKVTYISSLETSGKISPEEAYNQIKFLWQKLEQSKENLIDNPDFTLF